MESISCNFRKYSCFFVNNLQRPNNHDDLQSKSFHGKKKKKRTHWEAYRCTALRMERKPHAQTNFRCKTSSGDEDACLTGQGRYFQSRGAPVLGESLQGGVSHAAAARAEPQHPQGPPALQERVAHLVRLDAAAVGEDKLRDPWFGQTLQGLYGPWKSRRREKWEGKEDGCLMGTG